MVRAPELLQPIYQLKQIIPFSFVHGRGHCLKRGHAATLELSGFVQNLLY
jgi:hypothetical protein